MATGWVKTIEIMPAREAGKVMVVAPYAQEILTSGTPDAVASWLVTKKYFKNAVAAMQAIQRGKEVRGILKGVGYIQQFDTQAVS